MFYESPDQGHSWHLVNTGPKRLNRVVTDTLPYLKRVGNEFHRCSENDLNVSSYRGERIVKNHLFCREKGNEAASGLLAWNL